jgi:hypothetical protein
MAAEKRTTKKTATKPTALKAAIGKLAVKKAPAKKAAPKTGKTAVSSERFFALVSEAAYFAAQNDGHRKGEVEYWLEAENEVRAHYSVA